MLVFMMLVAGCGIKKVQDAKEPPQPQIGIVDMEKAVKSHPKYNQLLSLEQEVRSLAAQEQARQAVLHQETQEGGVMTPHSSSDELTELSKGFQQEFTENMEIKQQEINARLAEKEKVSHAELAQELQAYGEQLEKEYQPQIFNLQLKLKTIQLSKEEAASIQQQLEDLQRQHAEKIADKQKELSARMTEKMAPEKKAADQEMESYSKQLNEQIAKKAAAKQAEIAARNAGQTALQVTPQPVNGTSSQQLVMKQQEAQVLQDAIFQDIKDKTGKVAVASGLDAVLTNVAVNVNAVDITALVITECNKQ